MMYQLYYTYEGRLYEFNPDNKTVTFFCNWNGQWIEAPGVTLSVLREKGQRY